MPNQIRFLLPRGRLLEASDGDFSDEFVTPVPDQRLFAAAVRNSKTLRNKGQGCGNPMPDSSDTGIFPAGRVHFPFSVVHGQAA